MIFFPPCKINLGLRILRKRPDGFHDLETLFYPVPLRDALELLPSDECRVHVSGIPIPGDPLSNLCLKAYALLSADFPSIRPVEVYLYKHIPLGAGLGGGSADGAYTLLGLNRLFRLGLSREQLLPYALRLGSDCPFFLYEGPCLGSGRGEVLTPVELDLSGYPLVLVNPGIHVDTGWAFRELAALRGAGGGARGAGADGATGRMHGHGAEEGAAGLGPISTWKDTLANDFEPVVFKAHPEVERIKVALYDHGAVYAAMTGSGSTVFGIFPKEEKPGLSFPEGYWIAYC